MTMRSVKLISAVLLFALTVLPHTTGKVVGVTDGDTITVLTPVKRQIRVRLAGIDAPEKGQDHGDAARRFLSILVFGREVRLDGWKTDRYGRFVAKVIKDGKDVNLAMVLNGLAWHYKEYGSEQSEEDRSAYSKAELSAKKAKLNLWVYPNPTPPWEFRNGSTASTSKSPPTTSGSIIGNRNSKIYHWPGCPSYSKVAEKNRVYFKTKQEAERAGYRAARNC